MHKRWGIVEMNIILNLGFFSEHFSFIFLDVFFKKSLKNEKIKTPKITNNFEINPKMMDVCIAFFGPFLKDIFYDTKYGGCI